LKVSLISRSGVQDADLVNGDGFYVLRSPRFRLAHAASRNDVWVANE